MKLKNFMFATMIACAFASCSNDDEIPTPGTEPGTEGSYLEILVKDPGLTKAEALEPTDPAESAIKTLTAVVFDASGKIEAIEEDAKGVGTNSRKVALTPGTKSVIVIANYTLPNTVVVGGSYANLAALTSLRIDEDVNAGFSMSSKVYSGITVETNKTTYLGYTTTTAGTTDGIFVTEDTDGVKLYRNVAKVVLEKVSITNDKGQFLNVSNPNLEIEDVFILNAKTTTNLVASAADAAKHWAPTQSTETSLLGGVAKDQSWTSSVKFMLGASWTTSTVLKDNVDNITIGYKGTGMPKFTEGFKNTSFYVYENGSSAAATAEPKTLLVIKGTVTYDYVNAAGETVRGTAANRYYSLAIGRTGFEAFKATEDATPTNGFTLPTTPADFPIASRVADPTTTGINGADAGRAYDVLRNLQYNISLTVKGMGYDEPGGGDPEQYLDVQVRVVPFGQVNQNVEI